MIEIVLNGKEKSVEPGLTLAALITGLELDSSRVAVERNRQVVPRSRFASELVEAGDRIEIVTLVGGG
jgi:thiamine biosynthesis protein ThiS